MFVATSRIGILLFSLVVACGSASGPGGQEDGGGDTTCDCESDEVCIDERCLAASCENLAVDGSESDIDCGGSCSACAEGQACRDAGDCASRFCNNDVCSDCQTAEDCAAVEGTTCIGGTCALPDGLGQSCTSDSACESGHCSSGVCCSEACDDTCRSCLAAETDQVVDGVCADVLVATDPGGDCNGGGLPKAAPPLGCGLTGLCDGAGACAYVAEGTSCGTSCTDGSNSSTLDEMECDGAGTCAVASQTTCSNHLKCNAQGDDCLSECQEPSDCHIGYPCDLVTNMCCENPTAGAVPPDCLLQSL